MTIPTPNRRSFLKYAGAGTGAMMLGGLNLSALAATSVNTKNTAQDIIILNYALTLEYLEAEFYNLFRNNAAGKGAQSDTLKIQRVRDYANIVSDHENTHVAALQGVISELGGTPVAKPTIDFTPLLINSDGSAKTINDQLFLALAATFEPVGVRAYLGQADKIMSGNVLTAAASILAVEANHTSAIQELRRELNYTKANMSTSIAPQPKDGDSVTAAGEFSLDYSPVPTDFWKPLDMDTVLKIVGPLIK